MVRSDSVSNDQQKRIFEMLATIAPIDKLMTLPEKESNVNCFFFHFLRFDFKKNSMK
jgi:hypothetical protein